MLRIASIPSAHPYVVRILPGVVDVDYPHVTPPAGAPVDVGHAEAARLPDPLPAGQEPDDGVWWPPVMLTDEWVVEHAADLDLVHVHFGFETRTCAQLASWIGTLRAYDRPLVVTVHDLENPHLPADEQEQHLAALGTLVRGADEVLTLTPGAAAQIEQRWGVTATVVPHPQVVPVAQVRAAAAARTCEPPARPRVPGGDQATADAPDASAAAPATPGDGPATQQAGPRVGVHLGALRANADPTDWLAELAQATTDLGGTLDVVVNDEALTGPEPLLDRIRELLPDRPGVGLRVVPRMGDAELHQWAGGLDVLALPYRHGTHSGWLELCWDLGTSVLAPSVGHYAEQHDDAGFLAALEPGSVAAALGGLLQARREGCPWGDDQVRLAARAERDQQVRAAHLAAYRRAADRRAASPAADPAPAPTPDDTASATPDPALAGAPEPTPPPGAPASAATGADRR
ncbi:glycosyltransferase [Arsenicicoccus dermatophilus]|uniref:glycosyltransferase n=1 Tax=Arsenicicoccus dermatophilus TaxID=1076331 RepID=UPI0039173785